MNEQVIQVNGLQKSFRETPVLSGINITVSKGETLVILGKSGEGKSVTLKCIAGLLQPDSGSIKVFDEEVAELDEDALKKLRCRIGYLFQGAALYDSMTVKENLAFPLKRVLMIKDKVEIEKRSLEVLAAVGLEDSFDKMPAELSGGMRKRMALARTLIVNPEIILYDEPTTGLDTITSKEISQLILETQKKIQTTSVIVTHDMACVRMVADRIIILSKGKNVAEGNVKDLENSDDKFIRSFFN